MRMTILITVALLCMSTASAETIARYTLPSGATETITRTGKVFTYHTMPLPDKADEMRRLKQSDAARVEWILYRAFANRMCGDPETKKMINNEQYVAVQEITDSKGLIASVRIRSGDCQ